MNALNEYLKEIEKRFRTGTATEMSYRSSLETLFRRLLEDKEMDVIHEPKQQAGNAPDLSIQRDHVTLAVVETKDYGANLDNQDTQDQMERYLAVPEWQHGILTNYLEFRIYIDGVQWRCIDALQAKNKPMKQLQEALTVMVSRNPPIIGKADELTRRLASLGRALRYRVDPATLADSNTTIGEIYRHTTQYLVELDPEEFVDVYTQTIVYGLFAARIFHQGDVSSFTRQGVAEYIEQFPFLSRFLEQVTGTQRDRASDPVVESIIQVLQRVDHAAVMSDFGRASQGKTDPILHFYEDFLERYDPDARKERGVYYTSDNVVEYIVKSVDQALQQHLNTGLQEEEVHILDPAAGTGTFLTHTASYIKEKLKHLGRAGLWDPEVLKQRLHGFEIMMAPYVIAHMKLQDHLGGTHRVGLWLTNALEAEMHQGTPPLWMLDEAQGANRVKQETPIMVIVTNPPYNTDSMNQSDHIMELIQSYKPTKERNPKIVNDDYIKFIRMAEWMITKNGKGVLGFITNHGWLDNMICWKMRQHLLQTFDSIDIVNLHGSTRRGETGTGLEDENVFDIMVGVAILIATKTGQEKPHGSLAKVRYYSLRGARDSKLDWLVSHDAETTPWQTLQPKAPGYYLVPRDESFLAEYDAGLSLHDLFRTSDTGIQSSRDRVAIQFTEAELQQVKERLLSEREDSLREWVGPDSRDWALDRARESLQLDPPMIDIAYKPFDVRKTYYTQKSGQFLARPRTAVSQHMVRGKNIALGFMRTCSKDLEIGASICTPYCLDGHGLGSKAYMAPLWLYPEEDDLHQKARHANLSDGAILAFEEATGLPYREEDSEGHTEYWTPLDLLSYCYGVLYTPVYRERYREYLRFGFPKIPLPKDAVSFQGIASIGCRMRRLHLMENVQQDPGIMRFDTRGSNRVERVSYVGECIHMNKQQAFSCVPRSVWEWTVGGYAVIPHYLKARKMRALSGEEVVHLRKLAVVARETFALMKELDSVWQG